MTDKLFTFDDGRKFCQQFSGGDVVTIHSHNEDMFVHHKIDSYVEEFMWIGLKKKRSAQPEDDNLGTDYEWLDGTNPGNTFQHFTSNGELFILI